MNVDVVVLDTETTGFNKDSDRVIEIGAVKLREGRPVSKFHTYLNAQGVSSSPGALAVHGITEQFLADKPVFSDVYNALLDFICDTDLVIHNAPFDVGFLDAELERVGYQARIGDICNVVDTLVLAKQRFPGQKNNLDILCKRYGVLNEHRTLHGALLDADLLAKVYLQMCVDQSDILSAGACENTHVSGGDAIAAWSQQIAVLSATEEECLAHESFWEAVEGK